MKTSRHQGRLSLLYQSGQGTVEFVLILVVTVTLVLMLSSKIYKPMGEFAKSYMGDYLGCLLDRGILPKLGSGDDQCSESLKLSEGNPLAPRAGGLNKSGSGSGTSSDSKNGKNKKNSPEQDEMSSSRSGQSGRTVGATPDRGGSRSRGGDALAPDNGKVTEIPAPLASSKYYKVSRGGLNGNSGQGRTILVEGLNGLLAAEKEKLKRRESRISKAGIVESEEDLGRPKKLILKPAERKVATEAAEEPWSFGRLIRFAIIAMILIAILVFLSGQAVQISKSWEK